ncbi:MAG: cytochrome b/b6 domain-containing protein [Alphaproteobacteria bacterium]|nr:cytochrome b/b6 domain-containing protein [Alphaproteobacteria bacterium]MDP6567764.1 cytochrome b/b6 domain-containing protein [Alphaproteobacteria bacterium]MDP6813932.1 cytochrome b/b6 domain-containing protein [Alphaproteobacteria bacterium]
MLLLSVPLAIVGADLPLGPLRLILLTLHKSLGVCLLGLWLTRLPWRLWQGWPRPLATAPWLQRAGRAAHIALYLLTIAAIISGWAYSSAAAFPVGLFGLFLLPPLLAPDKALADILVLVHRTIVYGLLALIVLHLAGAWYHHRVLKDRTLRRMLRG